MDISADKGADKGGGNVLSADCQGYFVRAARMVSEGVIDLKPFVSAVYESEQIKEAFESAIQGDKFRVVVKF